MSLPEKASAEYAEGPSFPRSLADMVVKTGKTVRVNISKGLEENTIPSVIGRTLSDAVFLLESYGYVKGSVSEEFSEMPIGVIIRQFPTGGSAAEAGTRVDLVVSKGEEIVITTVPSLFGMTLDEARSALERRSDSFK